MGPYGVGLLIATDTLLGPFGVGPFCVGPLCVKLLDCCPSLCHKLLKLALIVQCLSNLNIFPSVLISVPLLITLPFAPHQEPQETK